jgi:hypothetical protein
VGGGYWSKSIFWLMTLCLVVGFCIRPDDIIIAFIKEKLLWYFYMAKRGRIPKETKEKATKKKSCNLLSETIYMVVYHSKQSQNARRTKESSRCGPRKKRNMKKSEKSVFFPSLYGFLISLFYSDVM